MLLLILMQEHGPVMRDFNLNQPYLPQYKVIKWIPNHPCYVLKGKVFVNFIDNTFNGIITWRKNLFKLLSEKAHKSCTKELKTLLEHYNNNSDFQAIALDIFIVLPSLILQKPCKHSKAKDHCLKVEERMKLLQEDHILNIIKHCNLI